MSEGQVSDEDRDENEMMLSDEDEDEDEVEDERNEYRMEAEDWARYCESKERWGEVL